MNEQKQKKQSEGATPPEQESKIRHERFRVSARDLVFLAPGEKPPKPIMFDDDDDDE